MNSIADSSSIYTEERMLSQHQAALAIIQGLVSNPRLAEFNWLDLACGRGQIIAHLDKNLSAAARAKIRYFGYDINNDAIRQAEGRAENLDLKHHGFEIGALAVFSRQFPDELRFDFITLTNTVHEINPTALAKTLYDSLCRLSANGRLFVYDMESLPPLELELGAIPWKQNEVAQVIHTFLHAAGASEYEPGFGQWTHRQVNGWNAQIQRDYIDVTDERLRNLEAEIVSCTEAKVREILEMKFELCRRSLDSLTRRGAEPEEAAEKQRLLYDFWALYRALERTE
jgi:SAM-dependent methyltransferase